MAFTLTLLSPLLIRLLSPVSSYIAVWCTGPWSSDVFLCHLAPRGPDPDLRPYALVKYEQMLLTINAEDASAVWEHFPIRPVESTSQIPDKLSIQPPLASSYFNIPPQSQQRDCLLGLKTGYRQLRFPMATSKPSLSKLSWNRDRDKPDYSPARPAHQSVHRGHTATQTVHGTTWQWARQR